MTTPTPTHHTAVRGPTAARWQPDGSLLWEWARVPYSLKNRLIYSRNREN